MNSPPLICATALAAERGLRPLFSNLSLSVNAGDALYLRGANGSGKTTLLRLLAGLTHAESGEIVRPQQVLYWGHASAVKDELTAHENLCLLCANESIPAAQISAALARCGLAGRSSVLARRLSAGQRRRVGLAWLTLSSAKLWLLDEPTTALDAQGHALLAEILNAHAQAGGAAIIATHSDIAGLKSAPQVLALST